MASDGMLLLHSKPLRWHRSFFQWWYLIQFLHDGQLLCDPNGGGGYHGNIVRNTASPIWPSVSNCRWPSLLSETQSRQVLWPSLCHCTFHECCRTGLLCIPSLTFVGTLSYEKLCGDPSISENCKCASTCMHRVYQEGFPLASIAGFILGRYALN